MEEDLFTKIVELAKRRGFFWPSYEIYGGVAGFYDLGPLGTMLKKKIVDKWRHYFVRLHSDYVVEIETPIIAPAKVFEASGHVESFTDPIVTCEKCGRKFRADHIVEDALKINAEGLSTQELTKLIRERGIKCPACGGELGEVKEFNLLFRTQIGPYEGEIGYLRPELAQGMFVSFKRVYEAMRARMPIGIAQVGRVGRNEISPRQAMIRLREFTIMEMEYFIDPEDPDGSCPFYHRMADEKIRIRTYEARLRGEDPVEVKLDEAVVEGMIVNKCLGYWMAVSKKFMESLGVPSSNMYFEEKGPEERAHYSSQTFDQMVKVSRWGWIEVAGHSYRGSFDLSRHMKFSGQDLTVFKSFDKPIIVKRKKVLVDKRYVGKTFKDKAPKIINAILSLDPGTVERELGERGYLEVEGARIPREAIKIVEVEEKITGKRYVPHVVEPSFGVERVVYVTFEYAYREREGRVILSLPRDVAPIEVVVLPLLENDDALRRKAREVYEMLINKGFDAMYDDSGSIGRRYARADEIGVPAAVTIDYRTLEDDTVTIRDRDTWKQVRVSISNLASALRAFIHEGASLESLGEPVR